MYIFSCNSLNNPIRQVLLLDHFYKGGVVIYCAWGGKSANKLVAEPGLKPGPSSLDPTLLTTTFHCQMFKLCFVVSKTVPEIAVMRMEPFYYSRSILG